MIVNGEDDQDEQRRRLSAVLTSMGKTPADVAGLIARVTPTGTGLLVDRNTDPGTPGAVSPTALMRALVDEVRRFKPDVLILDPLAELHTIDENDNSGMREVAAEFRRLAIEHDLALILVHHTRKGLTGPGDMDAARGASSVVGAARIVLTVTGMDEGAAERLGIAPDRRRHYFRVDGAKSNYAELTDAEWFERSSYTVGTGEDTVAVPVPWTPPIEAVSLDTRLAIERAVEQGSNARALVDQAVRATRGSIRQLFEQHGIRSKRAQQDELVALLARGFVEAEFRKANRVPATGLRSPEGQPHSANWMAVAA